MTTDVEELKRKLDKAIEMYCDAVMQDFKEGVVAEGDIPVLIRSKAHKHCYPIESVGVFKRQIQAKGAISNEVKSTMTMGYAIIIEVDDTKKGD